MNYTETYTFPAAKLHVLVQHISCVVILWEKNNKVKVKKNTKLIRNMQGRRANKKESKTKRSSQGLLNPQSNRHVMIHRGSIFDFCLFIGFLDFKYI